MGAIGLPLLQTCLKNIAPKSPLTCGQIGFWASIRTMAEKREEGRRKPIKILLRTNNRRLNEKNGPKNSRDRPYKLLFTLTKNRASPFVYRSSSSSRSSLPQQPAQPFIFLSALPVGREKKRESIIHSPRVWRRLSWSDCAESGACRPHGEKEH